MNSKLKLAAGQMLAILPLRVRREILHLRHFGRLISRRPVTFLDKVQWRVLYDRRKLIAIGGDKLVMKQFASDRSSEVLIPETLWNGDSIDSILDEDWGCDWVLKPREGSGYIAFGSGSLRSSGIDIETVARWRQQDQYRVHGEWAYGQSEVGYLLERRIPTPDGKSPNDIRFFVFDGVVRLIQVDSPRFEGVSRRFYTPEWSPFSITQGAATLAPAVSPPERLTTMIQIASDIGNGYDFIRVDLYDVASGVFFGELTPYPTGGMGKYSSREFDLWLGSFWVLPTELDY